MLSEKDQNILGKLIIDNQDLDSLESKLSGFNIFEAIGVVRQEIRHSNFIAFLLNPFENHRLGDLFLKKLLVCTLLNMENSPLSPIEIDIADFKDVEIRREWRNIDILIYSPSNRLVCVIENKVDSSEHSNQLKRYEEIISAEFPSHELKKIFVYLTKDADDASYDTWLPLGYEQVIEVIESICDKYQSTMGNDIYTLMRHYVNLVRRHIVSNSEIAKLCQKIYKQHRQALDLIYEHRPDLQLEISEFLQQMIKDSVEERYIVEDYSDKKYIRFAPKEWDDLPFQKTCIHWTDSKRILLFQFGNDPQNLRLDLVIGPGDLKIKTAISDVVKTLRLACKHQQKETGWTIIRKQEILRLSDYVDEDLENLQEKIKSIWEQAFNHEIKLIREAISQLQLDPSIG
ncbi:MAG: hypothetical protein DCF20_07835 [Pseudanabaena sp.]|nr:MAG: hypothetical protein DCF20_07835 [Pseudanabaena sp.]